MKSHRLILSAHGKALDSLKFSTFTLPELNSGEVLLRIHASPINPADINWIEGNYGVKPQLPAVAGTECVATVVDSRCPEFTVGQRVIAIQRIGCWAEHAIAQAKDLIAISSEVDLLQAAMLKVNPLTAHLLLHSFETLQAGDWIVCNAANSGVGQCIIQLSASMGLHSLCFVRNPLQIDGLKALGADQVFVDSAEGLEQAREVLGKDLAKLAFNAVGGDSALRLMKLLTPSATFITYGAMSKKPLTIPNGFLIFNDLQIRGLWVTRWLKDQSHVKILNSYNELATSLGAGTLFQRVDSTFSLSEFREAIARLDHPERNGKVLFRI